MKFSNLISPFETAISHILGLSEANEKEKWTNALRLSLNHNSELENPLSVDELRDKVQIDFEQLHKNAIILDVLSAHDLIHQFYTDSDALKVIKLSFDTEIYFQRFGKEPYTNDEKVYLTYAELFEVLSLEVPQELLFDELSSDLLPSLSIWIDKGDAPNEKIKDLLEKISCLYKLCGGSGITFKHSKAEKFVRELV